MHKSIYTQLGGQQTAVDETLHALQNHDILNRIWQNDYTVWNSDPTEITNRLGWLNSPNTMAPETERLHAFAYTLHDEGYTHALLLGMGGSSLAPEMFYKTFGMPYMPHMPYLELLVLDSTDPDMVREYAGRLNPATTLYIVATKSGGTVETLSGFKYFYNQALAVVGAEKVGQHFIAITDPGSSLITLAEKYAFREIFINDPNIGGRYSVLSFFGLVPAALVGVNLTMLLARADTAVTQCQAPDCLALQLGAIMGTLAQKGCDKLTILTSPRIASFGDWAEQLIAESTGKNHKGILPVVGEPVGAPEAYRHDRLFVYLQVEGDTSHEQALMALEEAGHPVVVIPLDDLYDLGGQFLIWELATAVAGHVLGIHPFDQPNVESAKIVARQIVKEYMDKGVLPAGESIPPTPAALHDFLAQAPEGAYIALQAYVHPTPATDEALLALRTHLRDRYQLATTVGYGPRFLHSTGQLHKGDGGRGMFIQFINEPQADAAIPDEAGQNASTMSFGVLKLAQALGDGQALQDNGRHLIRFQLGQAVVEGLHSLLGA